MGKRQSPHRSVETDVLIASRRRCCLCVYLQDRDDVRNGQIAHLNHNPSDSRFENLVWLCLEHHNDFDTKISQAKGFTLDEVRKYRDRLYAKNASEGGEIFPRSGWSDETVELEPLQITSEYVTTRRNFPKELGFLSSSWHYPLWQVANEPEFFAYKAGNRADGVCLIERIDLPSGKIVIACIQMAGNPGQSITNCVEELCFQVCERFDIPADQLIWLEHYDFDKPQEWNMLSFAQTPPRGPFAEPSWIKMTPQLWRKLGLSPKKRLTQRYGHFNSKLTKLFHWPTEAIL
jgi:hypothetical protein